jgi:hypothetical protein
MIISKPYGVIYVAVPKTASQSLSLLLEGALKVEDCPYVAESMHDFHATLNEAIEVTDLPLEHYWSFAFVRNPFDRFISYCAGHVDGFNNDPGNAMVRALEEARAGDNRWLLSQRQFVEGVTQVYRYEELNAAVADIAARLEIDLSEAPRLNASERQGYRGYFTDQMRADIAEIYASDLSYFDYRF